MNTDEVRVLRNYIEEHEKCYDSELFFIKRGEEIIDGLDNALDEIDRLEKRYREHPWNPAKIEQDTKNACFEVIWPLVVEMAGGY